MKTDHKVLINCKAKLASAANSDWNCNSNSAATAHNLDDVYCTLALQPAAAKATATATAATAAKAVAAAAAATQNRTTVKANEQTKMNERCEQRQSDERSGRPLSAPKRCHAPTLTEFEPYACWRVATSLPLVQQQRQQRLMMTNLKQNKKK